MNPAAKKVAAVAALVATVGSAVAAVSSMTPTARGVLESGPLPVASRAEVVALTATVGSIQAQISRQSSEDAARDKLLALTRQQQLESMLAGARADLARAPSSAARTYVCELISEVDDLRRVNGFRPIPRCQ